MRVLEPGTFKLSGSLSEDGVGALHGATVEVLSGTGTGLRATSDSKGYALYGVAGPVRLRASAEGFTPQVLDVVVTGDTTQALDLTPAEAVTDVSGFWTMTVSPSPGCRPGLPDIARRRTYQVELIQNATRLQVKVSNPTLRRNNQDHHFGTVLGSSVRLIIVGDTDNGEWTYPDLYDQLSPTEAFGFSGSVQGTVNGSEIRATMDGDLVYFKPPEYHPRGGAGRRITSSPSTASGSTSRGQRAGATVLQPIFNPLLLVPTSRRRAVSASCRAAGAGAHLGGQDHPADTLRGQMVEEGM